MSLVEALQVSPARTRRKKKVGTCAMALYSPKMSGGVRVEVFLLDGRKLEFSVGVRLLSQELLALVTSHFSLRESQYFALAFRDNTGHYHWLLDDRRLLDHDFARGVRVLPLHFLVRFFPENVTELRDAQTVELFYQQARNAVAKGAIQVEESTAGRLFALSLQASLGDYVSDAASKAHLKKSSLAYTNPSEHSQRHLCEERVCGEHQQLIGLSRGDAILSYMRQIESIPGYGVHFYEVRDRTNLPWYLGISHRGIAQYDSQDKRNPKRLFFWKQLENLYFRERKFSIEVHDPKRVSVSRRTFGPGNVSVYVWFAESQSLCKSIWSMAIAQHQFYLDRKTSRVKEGGIKGVHDPPDFVGELSKSCLSLSTHSSSPNLSRSGSHSSLQHHSQTEESVSTESLHAARMEMVSALQQRYDTLQEKLEEKTEELRLLCLREGELTGELPPEYPSKPGEPPPVVRKRVGTSFMLDEALINKIINKQEETVASLELEYEIQAKIVSAALRLANECSLKKGLRKQRKLFYHQATQRLRDIEQKVKQAKSRQAQVIATNASTMPKMKKKPRPVSDSEGVQDDSCVGLKETSFVDGVSLTPNANASKHKSGAHSISLHSAPPSPQRSSSGGGTPSETSSGGHHSANKNSRSTSPSRPTSGYIPSVVYTRSQYRAQHYPTLSTRGQSVPCETLSPQRSFNGGLYNLPHQRTSLASHSLEELDSSNPSPLLNPVKNPSLVQLPPHPLNYQYTPHHHHFKHHTHSHAHTHARRTKNVNESHDRFGSLDRRRATSGRFESRSMEHLDSLPHYPIPSPSPTSSPSPHPSHYDYGLPQEPMEGNTFPYAPDVDGPVTPSVLTNGVNGSHSLYSKDQSGNKENDRTQSHSRGVVRSNSGRGYMVPMDTGYIQGTHRSYPMGVEPGSPVESNFYPSNQENIPPPAEVLIPLKVSNPAPHRGYSKREGYATSLRSTASVNAADHLRPFRLVTGSGDTVPLRSSKSGSELPPLKPTNGRHHDFFPPVYPVQMSGNHDVTPKGRPVPLRGDGDSSLYLPPKRTPNGLCEEPLISLADGARLRKEQREREWYDGGETAPSKEKPLEGTKVPSTPAPSSSLHNVSTSSLGSSSESSGSVFPLSANEGSDSLNSTLNSSPLNASLNATLTVISKGSFQPSREVSKPFEMADFYKYSTKFRRKSSSSSGAPTLSSENGGSDSPSGVGSPLSPSLPPRSSQLVINVTSNSFSNLQPVPTPPSPSLIAQQSSPAPQQKGIYQPLTPLTCKPLEDGSPDISNGELIMGSQRQRGPWDHTPVHQAVPVTVTTKRSATLV